MVSDDEIARRVLAGESRLYAEIIDVHQAGIYAYARSRGLTPADAEDMTQETFIEAYLSLARYELGTDFAAWIRAICRNLVRSHVRSLSRRRETTLARLADFCIELEDIGDLADAPAPGESMDALRQCLGELDELSHRVVAEFYHGARSLKEIAERAGQSVSWVGVRLHRARHRLRACLVRAGAKEMS